MGNLTPKQKKFCELYVSLGNGTLAAEQAGYKKDNAYATASENLRKPQIIAYIRELQGEFKKNTIMTATERQEWLTEIIKSSEQECSDRLKALDILNKMSGEYITKQEVKVESQTVSELSELLTQRSDRNASKR